MNAIVQRDAYAAAEALAMASILIADAVKALDSVPSRFLPQVEAIEATYHIDATLASDLSKLADRLQLDADYDAERDYA